MSTEFKGLDVVISASPAAVEQDQVDEDREEWKRELASDWQHHRYHQRDCNQCLDDWSRRFDNCQAKDTDCNQEQIVKIIERPAVRSEGMDSAPR